MRIVVLDGFPVDQGDATVWDPLRAFGEVEAFPRTRPEERAVRCAGADVLLTNKVVLDASLMRPPLRYIGVTATGVNVVDLAAARQGNVAVTNVPGYSTDSVAQLVFAFLLHFTHDVAGHAEAVKAGRWAASPDFCFTIRPLHELSGKTLVLFGGGAIGQAVARLAAAFGMRTLFAAVPGSTTPGRMPMAEALPRADFVSLHCPLTEATRGFVDADFLARLKPAAVLVNTGRGPLLNDADVVTALDAGRLGGLALDVLAQEPPAADHPLLDARRRWARKVLVTPHLGWATVEARRRLVDEVIGNLRAFTLGRDRNRVA